MPAANQPLLAELERVQSTLSARIDSLRSGDATAAKVKEAQLKNWQSAAAWFVLGVAVAVVGMKVFGVV